MSVPAFLDPKAHPAAGPYYQMFPWEPMQKGGLMKIGPLKVLQRMTFVGILEEILKLKTSAVLIVTHGTQTGLALPLMEGGDVGFNLKPLQDLLAYLDGKISDEEARRRLYLNSAGWARRLKGNVEAVRKRRLARVELRACDTGRGQPMMQAIKAVFGCQALVAPKIKDVFAWFRPGNPTSRPQDWRDLQRLVPRYHVRVHNAAPHRFGEATRVAGAQFATESVTESWAGAQLWASAKLVPGRYRSGPLPFHGLLDGWKSKALVYSGEAGYPRQLAQV